MLFEDRRHAGEVLARRLAAYADRPGTLVLALPRGGVPVAFEVARALRAPLDVFLVRKLGVPGSPELAFGAIATGGVRVLNRELIGDLGLSEAAIEAVTAQECLELSRREAEYRRGEAPPQAGGRTVVLVDDGLATGYTMRAAVEALRRQRPARLVVAVPVAPAEACRSLLPAADEVVCAATPASFFAVGNWYQSFGQVDDGEVRALLSHGRAAYAQAAITT